MNKLSADFRKIARNSLTGKWVIAVLVGVVASILGGNQNIGSEFNLNIDLSSANANLEFAGYPVFSSSGGFNTNIGASILGSLSYVMIIALVFGILYFIFSSIISVGYAKFNLNLVDEEACSFENLFSYFNYWKTIALTKFFQTLYIFLWTLLFIIPGIIASFSYAMTGYILAENPEMTHKEALAVSKEMMSGNRWRLFCLYFSFIGWDFVCLFTLGLGHLFLTPYKQAAVAAFYREVSGTEHTRNTNEYDWIDTY